MYTIRLMRKLADGTMVLVKQYNTVAAADSHAVVDTLLLAIQKDPDPNSLSITVTPEGVR